MARPLKFTPDEVLKMINKYFADKTDVKDQTITGIALLFGSKQLMNDYQNRPEYSEIITLAKLRIEDKYERMLSSNAPTGAIFALKNFGWTDKQEIQHSGEINIPPIKWADDKD